MSRYGLVAFGSSLDCVSVFGRTVDDAAKVLSVMSGADPLDATTLDRPPMRMPAPRTDLRGLRIGLPREYFPADLHPGVSAAHAAHARGDPRPGRRVCDVSLPHTPFAVPTYYIVAPAEAAANLARFDGVRYGPRKVGPVATSRRCTRRPAAKGSAPRCAAAFWWAPTC